MKKLTTYFLVLATLLSVALSFISCGKLTADYVRGDEVVIDNVTPFVYNESTFKIYRYKNKERGYTEEYSVSEYVRLACDFSDYDYTYKQIASLFGNKILRHYTENGKDTYYTVYSLPDNSIFYLSCYLKDGEYYLDKHYSFALNSSYDIRTDLTGYVYDHDTPSAILGDKLPADCYLDYYSAEVISRRNSAELSNYLYNCNKAGIGSDPFGSDYYVELYEQDLHYEIESSIRCVQYVSFDIITEKTGSHGIYAYDIFIFKDGTAHLIFYHYKDKSPRFTLIQKEMIQLSSSEVEGLKATLEEWDFENIPTWNPEEFKGGVDGETTYIFAINSPLDYGKLISMWESTERYGIYHIRSAIEELVQTHVTVNEGRVYNEVDF